MILSASPDNCQVSEYTVQLKILLHFKDENTQHNAYSLPEWGTSKDLGISCPCVNDITSKLRLMSGKHLGKQKPGTQMFL